MNDDTRPGRPPSAGRPPRMARPRAIRPELPADMEPDLPRNVHKELSQHVRSRDLLREVAVAVTLAAELVDDDQPLDAVPYLEWTKSVAPRSPVIRETLAIAHYLAQDFKTALGELRAYRRLSGAQDQDHLLADCLRATGRSTTEVGEVVEALLASEAPADRRLEGLLVWAGAVADNGDLATARAVLRRADRELVAAAGTEAQERLTFVEGDLADRAGDAAAAQEAFERLATLDGDPFDVAPRLQRIQAGG